MSGDSSARIADQPLEHLHRRDVVRPIDAVVEGCADRRGVTCEVDAGLFHFVGEPQAALVSRVSQPRFRSTAAAAARSSSVRM